MQLSELEKSGCSVGTTTSVATPELLNLRQENENLRLEVAKWKELLLLREIRNGGKVVLGNTEVLQPCINDSVENVMSLEIFLIYNIYLIMPHVSRMWTRG